MSRACFSGHDLVGKIDNWSFLRGIVVFSSEFLDWSMIAKLWKFDVTADQAPHSGPSLIIPPMVRQSSRRYIFNGLRNYNSKPCSRFANRPPPLQTKSKFRSLGLHTMIANAIWQQILVEYKRQLLEYLLLIVWWSWAQQSEIPKITAGEWMVERFKRAKDRSWSSRPLWEC